MVDSLLTPLSINVPLVDPATGNPTPYFQQLLQQLLKEKKITDGLAEGAVQGDRQVIAGAGLTGGGDLSADRTLDVGAGTGITVNANDVAIDITAEAERIRDVIGAALVAGSNVTITVNDAGDTITIGASGGGGGGSTPTVRSSNIQSSSANSYVVSWPAGTIAGDVVIIFVGHGFGINTPTNWLAIDTSSGSNWNGKVFIKEMTAADITAGSVTVTTGGTFNGVLSAVTVIGSSIQSYISTGATRSSAGALSVLAGPAITATDSDLCLVFLSNRANNVAACNNAGHSSLQTISAANASGCVESVVGDSGPLGFVASGTFSTSGTGYYIVSVALRG